MVRFGLGLGLEKIQNRKKAVLYSANNDLVGAMAEIALNSLKGKLVLKPT